MGSKLAEKKRKSREPDSESDHELANGLFDGVLSQSEDEEDYVPSDDADEDEDADDSGSEGSGDSEDDEEDEEDDGILSDDIPSDVDGEEEMNKLVKQQGELEITEPGVDPKRKEDDDQEGKNYRVERDANGGLRYVYECVLRNGTRIGGWALTPFA
jgi:ribosome biogenesis protein ERB1